MTQLILLVGSPGSLKSTFIKDNGLTNYTISVNNIHPLIRTPQISITGNIKAPTYNQLELDAEVNSMIVKRMEQGIPIIVDDYNCDYELIVSKNLQLTKIYGYKLHAITFYDSLNNLQKRNEARVSTYKVDSEFITLCHKQLSNWPEVLCFNSVISSDKIQSGKFWSNFEQPFIDYSKYSSIYVVGDLQGCKDHLDKFINNNSFVNSAVIFLGDLTDRGPDNVGTILKLVELKQTLGHRLQVLRGNHDIYSQQYFLGHKTDRHAFDSTYVEFENYGFNDDQIDSINDFYSSTLWYLGAKYMDTNFIFTHGGLPCVPNLLVPYPGIQYIRGAKSYIDVNEMRNKEHYSDVKIVDENFTKWSSEQKEKWYSFHGHRNPDKVRFQYTKYTFNLESGVEKPGGFLSVVKIIPTQKTCQFELMSIFA